MGNHSNQVPTDFIDENEGEMLELFEGCYLDHFINFINSMTMEEIDSDGGRYDGPEDVY